MATKVGNCQTWTFKAPDTGAGCIDVLQQAVDALRLMDAATEESITVLGLNISDTMDQTIRDGHDCITGDYTCHLYLTVQLA